MDLQLSYVKGKSLEVQGYIDSDFAGDLDKKRSKHRDVQPITFYVFVFR